MKNDTVRRLTNLLSAILALMVNILAATLPLNGQNTGEISDRFQVYFVPAGYVFSIWGIIYLGWIAFTLFQLRSSQRENIRLRQLGYSFALSNLANAAWLFCWHYNQFGLSVLIMLALLGLLITFTPTNTYHHFLSMQDDYGLNKIILNDWGLTQSIDQQAAGLIMWVPCCLIYVTGAMYLLVDWFKQKEKTIAYSNKL